MLKAGKRGLVEGVRSAIDELILVDGCTLWNCDIATPYLWPVYPDKE